MVSDGSIQFPPGQRRDKPKFEPPPWEREQFDELAKRKKAEEPEPPQQAETPPPDEPQPQAAPAQPVPDAEHEVQAAPPRASEPDKASGTEASQLDPQQVEMLLMGLRAEEPRAEETYWKITTIVGLASALIGLILTVWGIVAAATPKQAGAGGAFLVAGLLLFGLGFLLGGAWVVFRSLRQQGVL